MDTIKILFVEHEANDLELLQYELKKAALNYIGQVVQTRDDYVNALETFHPQLILSDYSLPLFDGLAAFNLRQTLSPDTPFIFVSGMIGEENAVELIKSGATDYILKEKMYQAAPKIFRALNEAKEREHIQNSEKQLLEHLRHIEDILESIKDGFCSLDRNWIVKNWNKSAEQMTGVKWQQILNKNMWDVFPDAVNSKFFTEYHLVMNEGTPSSFEEYFPPLAMWCDVNVNPSKDGISVFFRDITEKRRQQKLNLLEKEVLELNADKTTPLEQTIKYLITGVQEIHREICCTFLSAKDDGLHRYLKNLPDANTELIETITMDLVNTSLQSGTSLNKKMAIDDLKSSVLWKSYSELDDTSRFKSFFSYPVFNADQRLLGILGIYSDAAGQLKPSEEHTVEKIIHILKAVIENKIAEIAIRNSEEISRMIMDASLDAIICIDAHGAVTLWNPEAEKIFRRKAKDMIGKELASYIIPEQYRENYRNGINQFLRTGHSSNFNILLERSALNYEGKEFPVELTMIPLKQEHKLTFCVFIRDISERKHNESALKKLNEDIRQRAEELAVSNAELEQFAFIASHDLQEPLRMISSFLAMLELKYKDQLDETANQYIHFAIGGAARSRKLIQDLLQFSRVGRKDVRFETIDMNKLLDEVINLNKPAIDEKNAVIENHKLPVVYGSPVLLQQVLQNLILNGLKYQKNGTKPIIKVKSNEKESCWEFCVEDNGIGIDPKFFRKIFVLFQRLHNKDEFDGTGIGLSVCKKIVEGHQGKIWVESKPGEGSSFFFTIPKNNIAA